VASRTARHSAAASGPPAFRDRADAGERLGVLLRDVLGDTRGDDPERSAAAPASLPRTAGPGGPRPVVLALPRGGVPVAAEVARVLRARLDILLVRKLGHPEAPELGLGAIAEDGVGGAAEPYFDADLLRRVGLGKGDLAGVVARERAELARRVAVYAPRRQAAAAGAGQQPEAGGPDLAGRLVIVVDDGLATGVTARAALRSLRSRGAGRTVLAVPVAPVEAVRAMETEASELVTLVTASRFRSVGEWYADFGQLTDADVLAALRW
jgi:putative phosphoribosyl transferase